jgi:hypothetical protein
MRKTFLICSLVGRLEGLFDLITSLGRYGNSWDIAVIMQKYDDASVAIIEAHCKKLFVNSKVYSTDKMTGPHLARCMVLDKQESDVWCILDDDMLAIEHTDYDKMAEIVYENKNIGFLSGNWRKSESMIPKAIVEDKLLYQSIVYTGGGMMFREDVAEIIRNIPRTMYVFDNPLWSIYSYVNGYDNCRYMGSLAIHRICGKGGRIKWLKENEEKKSLPPAEWIQTRRGKGKAGSNDEFLICTPSDITALAKELHKKNKK